MENPTVYLADKYSGDVEASVKRNLENTKQLRKKGFVVLSPINHTHTLHEYCKQFCPECNGLLIWYSKAIATCELCEKEYTDDQLNNAWNTINEYVAWDLALLASMCKYVPSCMDQRYPEAEPCKSCIHNDTIREMTCPHWYQPHVVAVFAEDCFNSNCRICDEPTPAFSGPCIECDVYWASKGAWQEYKFCHDNHIKCIRLTELDERLKEAVWFNRMHPDQPLDLQKIINESEGF